MPAHCIRDDSRPSGYVIQRVRMNGLPIYPHPCRCRARRIPKISDPRPIIRRISQRKMNFQILHWNITQSLGHEIQIQVKGITLSTT